MRAGVRDVAACTTRPLIIDARLRHNATTQAASRTARRSCGDSPGSGGMRPTDRRTDGRKMLELSGGEGN